MTDTFFRERIAKAQPYTVVILKPGPRYSPPGPERDPEVAAIILQHAKRNMALGEAGLMPVVCPIGDGGDFTGVGIFVTDVEESDRIYALDPAVQADVLTYEVHATFAVPGSTLPL